MICVRCDQPIAEGQAMAVDVERPTAAGFTVYIHDFLCRRAPIQTTQDSLRH